MWLPIIVGIAVLHIFSIPLFARFCYLYIQRGNNNYSQYIQSIVNFGFFKKNWKISIYCIYSPYSPFLILYYKRICPNFFGSFIQLISIFLSSLLFFGTYCIFDRSFDEIVNSRSFKWQEGIQYAFTCFLLLGVLLSFIDQNKANIYWQQFSKHRWTIVTTTISLLGSIGSRFWKVPELTFYLAVCNWIAFLQFLMNFIMTYIGSKPGGSPVLISQGMYYNVRRVDGSSYIYHAYNNLQAQQSHISFWHQPTNLHSIDSFLDLGTHFDFVESIEELVNIPTVSPPQKSRSSYIFLACFIALFIGISVLFVYLADAMTEPKGSNSMSDKFISRSYDLPRPQKKSENEAKQTHTFFSIGHLQLLVIYDAGENK